MAARTPPRASGNAARRTGHAALLTAYLLQGLLAFLHPLEERPAPACVECPAEAAGPAIAARCDGPRCPDPTHHHHQPRASHEPDGCPLCAKHLLGAALAPVPEGTARALPRGEVTCFEAADVPAAAFALPTARAPPARA